MDARDTKESEHSAALRREFETRTRKILFQYRDMADPDLKRIINRLTTSLPHLFVFLEHTGIEPTNNAAERALRHLVVTRKISGQIKGRDLWLERWSYFMTCVLSWWAQGKSIIDEIAKII